jgi:guanine deaminase
VIVKDNEIVGEGYNQVYTTFDPTCHAEVAAIRDASKNLKSFHLQDCDVYTSNEPCPMCLSACYWARVRKIYYAGTIADARDYGNFDDDVFYDELKKAPEDRSIPVLFDKEGRECCLDVWKEFSALEKLHY